MREATIESLADALEAEQKRHGTTIEKLLGKAGEVRWLEEQNRALTTQRDEAREQYTREGNLANHFRQQSEQYERERDDLKAEVERLKKGCCEYAEDARRANEENTRLQNRWGDALREVERLKGELIKCRQAMRDPVSGQMK